MADSIREQIVSELMLRLEGISTTSGFLTNLGQNVFRWKTTEFQMDELPGLVLRDVRQTLQNKVSSNKQEWQLEIEIDAVFVATSTVGKTLLKAQADVVKAIGPQWRFEGLGFNGASIQPVSDESKVIQSDKILAAIQSRWLVTYRTTAWDPFTA